MLVHQALLWSLSTVSKHAYRTAPKHRVTAYCIGGGAMEGGETREEEKNSVGTSQRMTHECPCLCTYMQAKAQPDALESSNILLN